MRRNSAVSFGVTLNNLVSRSYLTEDDVLTTEERDYIIENTQYVGIVVPNNLSELFKV